MSNTERFPFTDFTEPLLIDYNRKMSRRLLSFLSGICLLFLFVFFSYLVHKKLFVQLDFNATVRLQDHISRRFDLPFSILSTIGQVEFISVILVGIFLFSKRVKVGIIAAGFFIFFHLIEIFGKYFVHHPPPPQFMLRTQQLIQFSPFTVREVNSYPSGHAGRTFFLSIICLILLWQSKRFGMTTKLLLSAGILTFALTMLVSRVYLGEHWLSDVIGGTILGSALGLFTGMFLLDKTSQLQSKEKKKSLFPKYKIEVKRVE